MLTKVVFLCTLLAYSMVVSQSFMYMLALKQVQLNLEAGPFIQLRQLIDASMTANFKYVVYTALLANLLLVILTVKSPRSWLFITAVIAFSALIVDVLFTLKGNLPINAIINTWSADRYPADWADYRVKWLNTFQYRQIANISGFISLLIGAVFGSK